jgi:hypothetical protein
LTDSTASCDSFGNAMAVVDPVGNRTETDFDTTYHVYPQTRDPLYFAATSDTRNKVSTARDFRLRQAAGHGSQQPRYEPPV